MTTSDVIALGALAVSIYTIISSELKSRKSDREQKVIKDEQDRLRKLLLEKETKSAINEMKAELGARSGQDHEHFLFKLLQLLTPKIVV